ncbi:unnamed protein product, partial [Mesorhabditis belari]|uniref:Palmitoyltransferase n=1 Tax=Mesorhabditis belari TaxID=2138241 RepID=A0AAF3J1R5_9BILA
MGCARKCFEEGGCCYRCLQIVRWLPVLFVFSILAWAYYAYVIQLCFLTVENAIERSFYLFGFHLFFVLLIWSYCATVFAKLHKPPSQFFLPVEILNDVKNSAGDDKRIAQILQRYAAQEKLPIRMRSYDGGGQFLRYCPKCHCLKPDRSHHCSMCGQCILKFDHHCPWVNTCVNYHNYKFFLHFLGYGIALCLFGFLTDMQYFIRFWKNDIHEGRTDVGKFHMLFLFFVSGMFSLSLGGLFFYHLYLVARNRTTIESFRPPMLSAGEDKHAFNMGIRANFRQVFGPRPLFWFLPVYSSEGDGVTVDCSSYQTLPFEMTCILPDEPTADVPADVIFTKPSMHTATDSSSTPLSNSNISPGSGMV